MPLIKTIPTLKQLRHLVALAEFKHFGKAAEACLITQASLSSSIKELELVFGCTLVERTKRSVKMTPIGDKVVARSQTVLVDVEDIVDLVASQGGTLSGNLRLGVIPTIAPFLLHRTLPTIRKAFPDLKLYLREAQTSKLLDDLKKGELDLVLIAFPYPTETFETFIFAEDPLWLAYSNEAKIEEQEQIPIKDIDQHNLILLEEGHCLRGHALAASPAKQFLNSNIMQGTSLNTLVQMVDSGLGSTIIPKMAVDGGIARGTKVGLRPIIGKNTSRQIGFSWRKSSPRKIEFKLLADFFQAELATPITIQSRDRR